MKLNQIIKELQNKGVKITFRKRGKSEGIGVRITSINGVKFVGSKGNIEARKLIGINEIAHRQKVAPLPKEIKNELNKTQKKFRESGTKAGKPTTKNVRWNLEHKGERETKRLLGQAQRYASGLAYTENVEALINRLEKDSEGLLIRGEYDEMKALDEAIALLKSKKDTITENQLKQLIAETYNVEKRKKSKGSILGTTFLSRIKQILQ